MHRGKQVRWLGVPAVLLAVATGLSGCSMPGTAGNAATPPVSFNGTWTYQGAEKQNGKTLSTTTETLRLAQKKGVITGSGESVKTVSGKAYKTQIDVHKGTVSNGHIELTLYLTPLNWGDTRATEVFIQNLHCTAASSTLHCRMDMPIYTNVRNVPQDFHRR